MNTHDFQLAAEEYIDNSSVCNALSEIAEVCRLKAQHIECNWQDDQLAAVWSAAAAIIERAETKVNERCGI